MEFFSRSQVFRKAFSCRVNYVMIEGKAMEDDTFCYRFLSFFVLYPRGFEC